MWPSCAAGALGAVRKWHGVGATLQSFCPKTRALQHSMWGVVWRVESMAQSLTPRLSNTSRDDLDPYYWISESYKAFVALDPEQNRHGNVNHPFSNFHQLLRRTIHANKEGTIIHHFTSEVLLIYPVFTVKPTFFYEHRITVWSLMCYFNPCTQRALIRWEQVALPSFGHFFRFGYLSSSLLCLHTIHKGFCEL